MAITLPSFVAPNELIQSAWGNGVVNALDELDNEKVNLTGGTMTGNLTINSPASTPLILKMGTEEPSLRWQSQAGTNIASLVATSTEFTLETLNNNPFIIDTPTEITHDGGSVALVLKASTGTPAMQLSSLAGTPLLQLTGSVTDSKIISFDNLIFNNNTADILEIDGGTGRLTQNFAMTVTGNMTLGGQLDHNGTQVGFYGTAPISKQTGVAVTIGAVHAALVALGLIAA